MPRMTVSPVATACVTGLALFAAASFAVAQARQIGGVGITVFVDPEFRGANATLREDTPNLQQQGMNDRISSLRVAPGELWEACERTNYGGRCQVFSGSESDLRAIEWDDMISSVRRIRAGRGTLPPIQPSRGQLELFSRPGFSGERRVFGGAIANLQRVGFNDQAMSLRLGRSESWQVCADADYQNCLVVNTDWADLNGLGLVRRISSLRPVGQGRGGGRPPSPTRLVLFDAREFRGQTITLDEATPTLGNFLNRAESAQVGGIWQLCDQSGFRGRCVIVSSNVQDLAALGLRNRVASARPRPSGFGQDRQ